MSQNQNIEELKRKFLEYLKIERGRSAKTIENYNRYLTRFFLHTKIVAPKDITERKVREFRLWLNRQPGASDQRESLTTMKHCTQNYYLIAIRGFLKFLQQQNIKSFSYKKIKLVKTFTQNPMTITDTELVKLLNAPHKLLKTAETKKQRLRYLRDTAIMELLASTKLRISEFCLLNRDININSLPNSAKTAIQQYLNTRTDSYNELFINLGPNAVKNIRLTPRTIERLLKYYLISANISKKITPQSLRNNFIKNHAKLKL